MRRGALIASLLSLAAIVPSAAATRSRTDIVSAGGRQCRLLPAHQAEIRTAGLPVATGSCPGIRPGAVVQTNLISDNTAVLCTLNFVFVSGTTRYIGTAGHCVLEGSSFKEKAFSGGTAPVALDGDGNPFGHFVYAIMDDSLGMDFSLIQVDPGKTVDPSMCFFGGPKGQINRGSTSSSVDLEYAGQGVAFGSVVPGRTAVALGMPNPDIVWALGVASPGDSGSGVISSDGRAVGVLVAIGASLGTTFGDVEITRLGPELDRAGWKLGKTFTLQAG